MFDPAQIVEFAGDDDMEGAVLIAIVTASDVLEGAHVPETITS